MWKLRCSVGGDENLVSLNDFIGRQVWEYDPNGGTPKERANVEAAQKEFWENRRTKKHSSDELMRMQRYREKGHGVVFTPKCDPPPGADVAVADVAPSASGVVLATRRALEFYSTLQDEDGHWGGDYGGPMFLLPGLVIACYISNVLDQVFPEPSKKELFRYLHAHQNEDGGWGLHIEGHSTMFGTVLTYVTLRLLGEEPDSEFLAPGLKWIKDRGSAVMIPSWGKFWLSVLGAHSWDGINPMPPEMWLLPYKLNPLHPGRLWCHCRMVYLPMSYIYGGRFVGKSTELVEKLKVEMYCQPYESIDWNKARNQCAKEDLYYPHPWFQDLLWWGCTKAEKFLVGSTVRKWALKEAMDHVHYEDENTRYVDIGPVNKVLNMLCCYLEDPDSLAFKKHLPRIKDYLWVAEDGMKMQGYNGSQLWDTTFAIQALAATGLAEAELADCMKKAHAYVDATQVRDNAPKMHKYYRHVSKGAWPFSTRDHGWPISDCSSEGLKAALTLAGMDSKKVGNPIPDERLFDCVNVILSYQNKRTGGGWATYENTRSYGWLEYINPAETFGDIMIDYSYVECSSACITALSAFRKKFPNHRKQEIEAAIRTGRDFLLSMQREDGSWYGSWGVCFTYAAWFGVDGLVAAGETAQSCPSIRKCCEFLTSKQRPDGGWGESYLSCQNKVYSQLPENEPSHVVNTAWAMLALIQGDHAKVNPKALHAAARYLMRAQEANGDWPQQHISGVFNRNCMITYANYRNIFPIWALGEYKQHVLGQQE